MIDYEHDDGSPEFWERAAKVMFCGHAMLVLIDETGSIDERELRELLAKSFRRRYGPGFLKVPSTNRQFNITAQKMLAEAAELITEHRAEIEAIAAKLTLRATSPV